MTVNISRTMVKQVIRVVAIVLALGASTSSGAEVLRDVGVASPEFRALLVMLLGGGGASIKMGEMNEKV